LKVWAPITSANSVHLAALTQLLADNIDVDSDVDLTWIAKFMMYPTKMTRGLEGLTQKKANKFLGKLSHSLNESRSPYSNVRVIRVRNSGIITTIKLYSRALKRMRAMTKIEDLKFLNSQVSNLGSTLANLIATEARDDCCKLQENKIKIRVALFTYFRIRVLAAKFVEKEKPGIVYLYNGRFLYERAISDTLKLFPSIEVRYYETIRDRVLSTNHGFHNRILMQKEMLDFSKNFTEEDIISIGGKYFQDLQSSKNEFLRNNQPIGSPLSQYICFFTSSDDEYVGFWDSRREYFGSQMQAIEELARCANALNLNLVVRLHPNLANKPKEVRNRWNSAVKRLSTVNFDANDKISSLHLIKNSLGVVTYGSTIGLEAVAARKPTLTLVDCIYDLLGCVDKATSLGEINDWLGRLSRAEEESKIAKRLVGACIRGLWIEKSGERIQVASMHELKWGAWEASSILNVEIKTTKRFSYGNVINKVRRLAIGCKD
jgi:hypothetical protein